MLFAIEHLEPRLSQWLFIEYSHAAEIVGKDRLLVTNVRKPAEFRKLQKVCTVEKKSVVDVFSPGELVVLDPQAKKELKQTDMRGKLAVVVGGILGDDPAQGRTKRMLTEMLSGAVSRNIGAGQFSIDGSVFVVEQISRGVELQDIPWRQDVEISMAKHHSVVLPFAYPLVDGKPLMSKKLLTYLKRRGDKF
jgi:ribosome biogenesis SPOUT family RNA methylase Rps3